jgi:hypothetical protein
MNEFTSERDFQNQKETSMEKEPILLELTADEQGDIVTVIELLNLHPDLRNEGRVPFPTAISNRRTGTITPPPDIPQVLEILNKLKDKINLSSELKNKKE